MSVELLNVVFQFWVLLFLVLVFSFHLLWFALKKKSLEIVYSFRMHLWQVSVIYFTIKFVQLFPLPGTRTFFFVFFEATLSFAELVDVLYFFLTFALLVFSVGIWREFRKEKKR
jgi:hypothetical protein